MTVTEPGVYIAVACAFTLLVLAIGGAVWGHLNPPKENDR